MVSRNIFDIPFRNRNVEETKLKKNLRKKNWKRNVAVEIMKETLVNWSRNCLCSEEKKIWEKCRWCVILFCSNTNSFFEHLFLTVLRLKKGEKGKFLKEIYPCIITRGFKSGNVHNANWKLKIKDLRFNRLIDSSSKID